MNAPKLTKAWATLAWLAFLFSVPLWMSDPAKTRRLAEDALELARELGAR